MTLDLTAIEARRQCCLGTGRAKDTEASLADIPALIREVQALRAERDELRRASEAEVGSVILGYIDDIRALKERLSTLTGVVREWQGAFIAWNETFDSDTFDPSERVKRLHRLEDAKVALSAFPLEAE